MPYKKAIYTLLGSLLFFAACKKSSIPDPAPAPQPKLSVADASEIRKTTEGTIRFYLILTRASSDAVSVDYTLTDGTAKSPQNYTGSTGTVHFTANQTSVQVEVPVKADPTNLREDNLYFTITLSNPKFCTLSNTSAKGTIITENGTYLPTDNTGYSTPETYPGYTLAWSDEFNGSAVNAADWNFETGNNGGWGNNELEYYTNSAKNSLVSNGNLIIEARKESMGGFNYTSARMTTKDKKAFRYGRIDIRAKLPIEKGIWPALWMLGANIDAVGWPACGEMDIMELVGHEPSAVHATMHWKNAGGGHSSKTSTYTLNSGNFSQQFHVFSMIWEQDLIRCYVDDVLHNTISLTDVSPAAYPFNADQFFIFNVAVGGDWPGAPASTTVFPKRMFVDYVRVFQQ